MVDRRLPTAILLRGPCFCDQLDVGPHRLDDGPIDDETTRTVHLSCKACGRRWKRVDLR